MKRKLTVLAVFLAAAIVAAGVVVFVRSRPVAAGALVPPAQDSFYGTDAPLDGLAPGTALKTRVVQIAYGDKRFPADATQILFRTTDQLGHPTAAVTTVIEPLTAGTRRIVSYHSPYDALGAQCDPSYALRGGNTGRGPQVDDITIAELLGRGYTVVVPDYEGLKMHWTMGRESGQTALDSIRAAETHLHAPASTPVALFGYSGGSVPTGFGAEMASAYAPELHIVAAAAGGVLVEPTHNLPYVNGSTQWAGVIPALMNVYNATYSLGLEKYLSPKGTQILAETDGQCLINFATKYPGLTDRELLQPQYPSLLDIPPVVAAFNESVMGFAGTPRNPMFLGVGNLDGTGDGIMLDGDVQGLATRYCREGVDTRYKSYPKLGHFDAYLPWSADAQTFVANRFEGLPAIDGYCRDIPAGNALGPVAPR